MTVLLLINSLAFIWNDLYTSFQENSAKNRNDFLQDRDRIIAIAIVFVTDAELDIQIKYNKNQMSEL